MNIGIKEFWQMSFAEFWPIYDSIFGTEEKEFFNEAEYNELMKEWSNGNN